MMFQNLKINSHIVLILCLFFFNCNKNNGCEFLDDNNQLLKPVVLKKFEDDVLKVFKNAGLEVTINAFLINEELDSISKNHYTANLISNYSIRVCPNIHQHFLKYIAIQLLELDLILFQDLNLRNCTINQ